MDFGMLSLAGGWRDAVFQVFGSSFHLEGRLFGVLSIGEGDYNCKGWN
jgi:hypothetical protein